ncbi:MAG: lipopolysaccharide heptosyltransferase I [Phascolarctobacterium sp.]|nr:lipopolysaccharide heptosyltransferase I [Phascolarctobacterium sp.]
MNYKNILLIKMSSLGDILHTLPFAAALRKRYPEAKITWLVHPQFAGFVPDPPVIDEVLYFDKVKFKKMSLSEKVKYFLEMRELLHSKHFDLVIDMQGLFKSAVLAAISGCSNRIGYCEMREGSGLVSRAITGSHSKEHVIERYLDVARYLGAKVNSLDDVEFPMPDLSEETLSVQAKLRELGWDGSDYVVIVPGARWWTKEWPVEHYVSLAKKIAADGRFIVLAGGPDDAVKGKAIAEACASTQVLDMTGKTSLRELAALIKGCSFYISADTGPLHFAAALKKPLVAMYGPTKADRTGPYGSKNSTVLLSPAKCAGCLKKKCDDWHCMHDITPDEVYKIYLEKVKTHG